MSTKAPVRPRAFAIPIGHRCFVLGVALAINLAPGRARAEPRVLDRAAVARVAATRSPGAVVAARRISEARALRVGARAIANPEISAYAGPRWDTRTSTDLFVGIVWPFDLSGAPAQRARVAEARSRAAEADADVARRAIVAEALDLWARARGADERARVEDARLVLDRTLASAAEARRRAGTTGDGEAALARILEAQGVARTATAHGERDALLVRLRGRLGIEPAASVLLVGPIEPENPPPLEALVARLARQPAIVRARASVRVAESDTELQERLGAPVPRVTAGGGRDPGSYLHIGLDVPVPLFQRNQTNTAVARARTDTAHAEFDNTSSLSEAELRGAYAEYAAARAALDALRAVEPQVEDAEHLATRSYELGQSTLTEVATVRREVAATRLAIIDAEVALALARSAVDAIAGTTP